MGGETKNTKLKNNLVFEVLTIQNTDVETYDLEIGQFDRWTMNMSIK